MRFFFFFFKKNGGDINARYFILCMNFREVILIGNRNVENYLLHLEQQLEQKSSYKNYVRWKIRNNLPGDNKKEWWIVRAILQQSSNWKLTYRKEKSGVMQLLFFKVDDGRQKI